MNGNTLKRTALAGLFLGAATLMIAGPAVGDANAGPRDTSKSKVVRQKGNDRGQARQGSERGRVRSDDRGRARQDHDRGQVRQSHHRRHVQPAPRSVRIQHRPRRVVPVFRHTRPWYRGARRILVSDAPYYYHAGFGIYFGGFALDISVGSRAPAGYAYFDPYCGETFWTLDAYRVHLARRGGWWGRGPVHPAVLELVLVADGRGEGGWCGR